MLNFLAITALANPGPAPEFASISQVIAAAIVAIACVLIMGAASNIAGAPQKAPWVIMVLLGLIVFGSAATWFFQLGNANVALSKSYNASVSEWLSTDYDVDLTPERTARLVEGEELSVKIDGLSTVVAIRENAQDELEFISIDSKVIEPKAS